MTHDTNGAELVPYDEQEDGSLLGLTLIFLIGVFMGSVVFLVGLLFGWWG